MCLTSGIHFFAGREQVLQTLHRQLHQDCAVALSQIQAISGLGGIGKTQTAVEYAYRFRADYDSIFWVRADTALELSSGFVEIAQLLNLPQQDEPDQDKVVQAVKLWLSRNPNWLLIFDNADQPELVQPFKPHLAPTGTQGQVLITSRAQDFQTLGIARPLEIETLEPAEALAFLWRRSGRGELSAQPPIEETTAIRAAKQLAAELGYLPLALEQAAAYVVAKKARFQDYLASYQTRKLKRLETAKPKLGNYSDSVATAWTLNFQQVEQTGPASADLLRVSALLHPDAIPFELLSQGGGQLGDKLAEVLVDAVEDPLVVNEVLEPLCTYSLIRVDRAAQTYSIHRLVQEVTRAEMATEKTRQRWINRAILAAHQLLPKDEEGRVEYQDSFQHWPLLARLTNHTQVLAQICHASDCQSLAAAQLFDRMGDFLREGGQYPLAESLLQQAYQLYQSLLEVDSRDVAQSLHSLARLYWMQGRYSEAEPLYQESLAMRKRLLGDEHPDVANSLNNLAILYRNQGRYSEAEPLFQEALAMRKRLLGEAHPDVAQSLNNLALLYWKKGRYSEAEPLFQEALALRKQLLGEAHPDVAQSLNNLALLYRNQGRYSEAEPLFQDSLAMRKRLLGEAHPDVAQSLNNLALLYWNQGRYSEAEPLFQEALAMFKRLLGDTHPDVATSLNNLATLYWNQGRYSEAEPLFQEALAIRKRLLGDTHPLVAYSLNNLGEAYSYQGRYSEAEPLHQEALALRKQLLGDAHPDVAQSLDSLGVLYDHQERYSEAEPLHQEALAMRKQLLGDAHPDVAISLNNLAELYDHQGRYSEAKPLFQEALAMRKQLLGDAHPDVGRCLDNLARLYSAQGDPEQARPLYTEALEILEHSLGADHPWTVRCRGNLETLGICN